MSQVLGNIITLSVTETDNKGRKRLQNLVKKTEAIQKRWHHEK